MAHILKSKTKTTPVMHILQYIVPIVTMISGIVITAIDQLVTTNITPFLMTSIVTGTVFLIRPIISAIIFLISYISFYFLIALTIADQQILLSNRVNGTTAIAFGFLISLMIWHYNLTNVKQRKLIDKHQEELRQMAYHDQLTNLYNRHFFYEIISKEFSSVQRYKHESAIIILDIDNFKNINDTYGHLVGDRVLKDLSEILLNNTRKSDIIARFGGEEFIILAIGISSKEGVALAEKLKRIIAKHIFSSNSTHFHITASFGVSSLSPDKYPNIESYISEADQALYLAKKRGKNSVEMIS